jgi:excisionase family DNA binding protein
MPHDYNRVEPEPLLNDSQATLEFGGTRCFEAPTDPPVAAADPSRFKLQYSRVEAAQMLSIGVRTLDRLIAEKQLPVRRVGRRVLITRDALERFIKRDHETGGMVH